MRNIFNHTASFAYGAVAIGGVGVASSTTNPAIFGGTLLLLALPLMLLKSRFKSGSALAGAFTVVATLTAAVMLDEFHEAKAAPSPASAPVPVQAIEMKQGQYP